MVHMEKLKIGVIGLGGIANYHIWGIEQSPDAELWAICDVNEKALTERGEALGIPEEHLQHLPTLHDGVALWCTRKHQKFVMTEATDAETGLLGVARRMD